MPSVSDWNFVHGAALSTGNAMDMYKCIAWELGLRAHHSLNAAALARATAEHVQTAITGVS
jgi:hypothetical protein